jgi:hypothetical protein
LHPSIPSKDEMRAGHQGVGPLFEHGSVESMEDHGREGFLEHQAFRVFGDSVVNFNGEAFVVGRDAGISFGPLTRPPE